MQRIPVRIGPYTHTNSSTEQTEQDKKYIA